MGIEYMHEQQLQQPLRQEIEAVREQLEQQRLRRQIAELRGGAPLQKEGRPVELISPEEPQPQLLRHEQLEQDHLTWEMLRREQLEQLRLRREIASRAALAATRHPSAGSQG